MRVVQNCPSAVISTTAEQHEHKKQFPVHLMTNRRFRNYLFTFCKAIANNTDQVHKLFKELKPLFASALQGNKDQSTSTFDKKEIHIAFWAFTKHSEQRTVLIDFLLKLFFPRVYVFSETKQSHLEGLFFLTPSLFNLTSGEFENWFERFLDILNMSAGVIPIDVYLGPQMLTCMDRIEHGDPSSLKHNLNRQKDFLILYRLKLSLRLETADVALQTHGMEFSAPNLISLYQQNIRLNRSLRDRNIRERNNSEALLRYNNAVNYPFNAHSAPATITANEPLSHQIANDTAYFYGDRNALNELRLAFMPNAIPFEPD